jgi:hypothetical protein
MPGTSVRAGFELASFSLISLACLAFAIYIAIEYYKAKNSASWPLVTAEVIASRVERGCGKNKSYHPHIEYKYSNDGGHLSSTKLRFGSSPCGSEASAKEIVAKYPVGAKVSVGVNPSNMFDAVLWPGNIELPHWATLLAAALLFIVNTFFLAKSLHARDAA